MFKNIISLILGYLIGSILPAYIIGKFKGFDIREKGRRYAGTLNVYRTLGVIYAIPVAIFDTLKGVFAILISEHVLHANFVFSQLSGFMAVLGHIFPFYLGFRGGQGVATADGVMLYYLFFHYFKDKVITVYDLSFAGALVLLIFPIVKKGEFVGPLILPFLCFLVFRNNFNDPYNPFFVLFILYIIFVNVRNIIRWRLINIDGENFRRYWWRVAFRPGALAFVIFYVYFSKKIALEVIGYTALFFILLDVFKLISKKGISFLFKKAEEKRFSSMSMFLIASFIIVLVFEKEIAIVSLIFLIFGDIFSKFFGLAFGRKKFFNSKTLEGSIGYFVSTLMISYIVYPLVKLPLWLLILGGLVATFAEILPLAIDDNLTVGIISGAFMSAIKYFV